MEPAAHPELERAIVEAGADLDGVAQSEALVWTSPGDATGLKTLLEEFPQLRWIQLPWAGVEEFAEAGVFSHSRLWTSAKKLYSLPVAEHALALALSIVHEIPRYAREGMWSRQYRSVLYGRRVGIVGAGGIGASIAALHGPFGCEISAVTRDGSRPEWARRSFSFSERLEAASHCDVVYLALPLVEESMGFVDERFLESLGSAGYLINVARGQHVDQDALVAALGSGTIAGAALDVTNPEPLPADHPLWTLENCLISPHTAVPKEVAMQLLRDRVTENIHRFGGGRPLLGQVDPDRGY